MLLLQKILVITCSWNKQRDRGYQYAEVARPFVSRDEMEMLCYEPAM